MWAPGFVVLLHGCAAMVALPYRFLMVAAVLMAHQLVVVAANEEFRSTGAATAWVARLGWVRLGKALRALNAAANKAKHAQFKCAWPRLWSRRQRQRLRKGGAPREDLADAARVSPETEVPRPEYTVTDETYDGHGGAQLRTGGRTKAEEAVVAIEAHEAGDEQNDIIMEFLGRLSSQNAPKQRCSPQRYRLDSADSEKASVWDIDTEFGRLNGCSYFGGLNFVEPKEVLEEQQVHAKQKYSAKRARKVVCWAEGSCLQQSRERVKLLSQQKLEFAERYLGLTRSVGRLSRRKRRLAWALWLGRGAPADC